MDNIRFTFIDLFAGIGGFKMALSNNAGDCVGFSEINQDAINTYCDNFQIDPSSNLGDITKIKELPQQKIDNKIVERDIFGNIIESKSMSLSNTNGFNDYFLFNDLRNGHTTIHSWDIIETTQRQKDICLLLLRNRRKSNYGELDGNPLSLEHFQNLDSSIKQEEIDELVQLEILKSEQYRFIIKKYNIKALTKNEQTLLSFTNNAEIIVDSLKIQRVFKLEKMSIKKTIESLQEKNIIECAEIRYDFKNTKISTGLFGVSRIFLPSSDIFPTLVASDTNDFITLKTIEATNHHDFKNKFIKEVYESREFRKITKREA